MDERESKTEDLPPLQLRELRRLELTGDDPAHLAAASGVVRSAPATGSRASCAQCSPGSTSRASRTSRR
jgi:hypothetical protein